MDRITKCDPVILPLLIKGFSILAIYGVDERAAETSLILAQRFYTNLSNAGKDQEIPTSDFEDFELSDDSSDELSIIIYLDHILPSDKMTLKQALEAFGQNQQIYDSLSDEHKQLYNDIFSYKEQR